MNILSIPCLVVPLYTSALVPSTTGVTKAVVCAVLSVGWSIYYKRTLAANWKE